MTETSAPSPSLTREQVERIDELAKKACPDPWRVVERKNSKGQELTPSIIGKRSWSGSREWPIAVASAISRDETDANAALIAALRNAWPALRDAALRGLAAQTEQNAAPQEQQATDSPRSRGEVPAVAAPESPERRTAECFHIGEKDEVRETPRTDARTEHYADYGMDFVPTHFARELEREVQALGERVQVMEHERDEWKRLTMLNMSNLGDAINRAERAEAERETFRRAVAASGRIALEATEDKERAEASLKATLQPWGDDVALRGKDAPKNDGLIKHLIEYLLTVYKRFGNTAITCDLQWGSAAMWKRDERQERIAELEASLKALRSAVDVLGTVVRNGFEPPKHFTEDDIISRTASRAFELHESLKAAQQELQHAKQAATK